MSAELFNTVESPEPTQAYSHVARFVHNVWEHPLVTPDLVEFRAEALSAAQDCLGVLPETHGVFALIAGSTIWGHSDQASDYDIFVVSSRPDAVEPVKDTAPYTHLNRVIDLTVDYCPPVYGMNELNNCIGVPLLYTPDQFIVGDLVYARWLRQCIVANCTKATWAKPINEFFKYHVAKWPYQDGTYDKRWYRFKRMLDHSSIKFKNPNWKNDFAQALDKINLPDLDVYRMALEHSQGALEL
ncbi:hypothetical protein KC980_02600 [candidate division WWE3 bacterium]|uniref:Uncharacterized protein n=1 Tax=candidate division WWE3 bacterium TaxID=2053526 RepID=A0A955EBE9_UNCKA|nr:hypothetical protein [candidate division WWE3 bacterium]